MHTFAKKPKSTQQNAFVKWPKFSRAFQGQSREVRSILHLQRSIDNQSAPSRKVDYSETLRGNLLPPASSPTISLQPVADGEATQGGDTQKGIEVGGLLRVMPTPSLMLAPSGTGSANASGNATSASICDSPLNMNVLTLGKFKYGKKLSDYYPDLVGTKTWGSNDTAGPFDNGFRAGSAVQLYGEYASPCADQGKNLAIEQEVKIKRLRGDGKKLLEGGKPAEGQTINDIKRSGRDSSQAPFRQTVHFAVTFADPISGVPYSMFKSYDFEADLISSLSGKGGKKSVNWGVTVKSANGKVTKNEVR